LQRAGDARVAGSGLGNGHACAPAREDADRGLERTLLGRFLGGVRDVSVFRYVDAGTDSILSAPAPRAATGESSEGARIRGFGTIIECFHCNRRPRLRTPVTPRFAVRRAAFTAVISDMIIIRAHDLRSISMGCGEDLRAVDPVGA
jgi:hypothetical protein